MIAYYVHHHGRGHLVRALAVAAHVTEPVLFLSSLPAPDSLREDDHWVELPTDEPTPGSPERDPSARGRLHWVPEGHAGLRDRGAAITAALARYAPRRIVVDVSVEVALLARLCGVPVTVVAMPGHRNDAPHRLAYDVADQIVAPWTEEVYRPAWLRRHLARTHFVGAISGCEGRERPTSRPAGGVGLVLCGRGGTAAPDDLVATLSAAAPDISWAAAGGRFGWLDDPWPAICAAEVVVCHAGQSAIADVALAEVPAVVVAEDRHYDEQVVTTAALARCGVTVAVRRWPAPAAWAALLRRARRHDGHRWNRLRPAGAAARAAAVIQA